MSDQQHEQQQGEQEEEQGEQIRIVLKLSSECTDSSLQVPLKEAIAVPCHLKRQGLSTVVNHLLGRKTLQQDNEDDDSDGDGDDKGDKKDDDDDVLLPAMNFEFTVGPQNKLLRTLSVEKEARRSGLSLEQAIVVTYFPAQTAPSLQGQSERLPDWISAMSSLSSLVTKQQGGHLRASNILCTATYDGSIHVFENNNKTTTMNDDDDDEENKNTNINTSRCVLERIHVPVMAHQGPIQCLDMASSPIAAANDARLYIASGSTDHSVAVHCLDLNKRKVQRYASCQGHSASIGALDLWSSSSSSSNNRLMLASGDWDGGLLIYNLLESGDDGGGGGGDSNGAAMDLDDHTPVSSTVSKKKKKQKTATTEEEESKSSALPSTQRVLSPMISIQAHHGAKISGISWGNHEKRHNTAAGAGEQLITASWDHSVKLWNIERRDCILTLNGSRVVSCMNTSPHSAGIVVTGHPDCTLRLWDVRTNTSQNSSSSNSDGSGSKKESLPVSIVSDTTSFRPSHRAWVSAVQWSPTNPYQLASASHDGTVKLWDIRSSLPLHTVRTIDDKTGKALCLTMLETGSSSGSNYQMFAGGTDCVVKQFQM